MELSDTVLAALAIGGAVVAVVAVAVAGLALSGQRRVQRAYRVFSRGEREDVLTLIQRHVDEVVALRSEVAALDTRADELRGLLGGCVSRVGTIRYDAFDEMGGHLSYSTALLDERGDGVVLTSIHGRTDTRSYVKPVIGGQSKHTLSEEEAAAIGAAIDSGWGRPRMVKPRARSSS